tara:strand:- start:68846 stop:69373 length:528 start_codon:yes stop_codon:yes gene_type:complete
MKNFFLLLTIFFLTNSYSQTKQETEDWILSKLRKYTPKGESELKNGYNQSNRTFSFDGVNFYYSYTSYRGYSRRNFKYTIPVWAILKVDQESHYGNLIFSLQKYCTECKSNEKWVKNRYLNKGIINMSEDRTKFTDVDIIRFQKDPEEDFINRFNKAIKHLQTLYPKKPITKEKF